MPVVTPTTIESGGEPSKFGLPSLRSPEGMQKKKQMKSTKKNQGFLGAPPVAGNRLGAAANFASGHSRKDQAPARMSFDDSDFDL